MPTKTEPATNVSNTIRGQLHCYYCVLTQQIWLNTTGISSPRHRAALFYPDFLHLKWRFLDLCNQGWRRIQDETKPMDIYYIHVIRPKCKSTLLNNSKSLDLYLLLETSNLCGLETDQLKLPQRIHLQPNQQVDLVGHQDCIIFPLCTWWARKCCMSQKLKNTTITFCPSR